MENVRNTFFQKDSTQVEYSKYNHFYELIHLLFFNMILLFFTVGGWTKFFSIGMKIYFAILTILSITAGIPWSCLSRPFFLLFFVVVSVIYRIVHLGCQNEMWNLNLMSIVQLYGSIKTWFQSFFFYIFCLLFHQEYVFFFERIL